MPRREFDERRLKLINTQIDQVKSSLRELGELLLKLKDQQTKLSLRLRGQR